MLLPSPLLVVTDRTGDPRPLTARVSAILHGGGRWIWFRDRDLAAGARLSLGLELVQLVRAAGARLVVGGDVALARSIGADGVHLGGGSSGEDVMTARLALGRDGLVGLSAHSAAEVAIAARAGADYATLSPIFATASKPGYGPALGPDVLRSFGDPGIPVIALGGMTVDRAARCRAGGFAGMAVMGGLRDAPDLSQATRAYLDAWSGADA